MSINCVYGSCSSDSRNIHEVYMKGVEFIPFPKPYENLVKCQRWADACGRYGFSYNNVTKDTYICNKHFVGENGPTKENPHPIPLYQIGDHCYTNKTKKNPFSSHKTCSVPQCFGRANSQISIHQFPKYPELREKWICAFRMKWLPKNPFACSLHFSKDQYHYESPLRRRHRLKRNAIPTLNLPDPSKESRRSKKLRSHDLREKIKILLQSTKLQSSGKVTTDRLVEEIIDKFKNIRNLKSFNKKNIEMFLSNMDLSLPTIRNRRKLLSEITTSCNEMEGRGYLVIPKKRVRKQRTRGSASSKTILDFQLKEEPIDDCKEFKDCEGATINDVRKQHFDLAEQFSSSDHSTKSIPPCRKTVLLEGKTIHVPDFIDCLSKLCQKECAVCFKRVSSREVCTFCPDCPETPPLCLQDCFRSYHRY